MSEAELLIRCDCGSPDHMVVLDVWHWDAFNPPHSELSVHIRLDEYLPWWKRLWLAARYAMTGKTQRYWWAETAIRDADAERLRGFLDAYLDASLNGGRNG